MTETVSVVIPVKDGERFMREAIESVLGQTRPPDEVVVLEGGSADRSREIAEGYEGVTVVSQQGTGLGSAWNEAVEHSTGTLLGFIDCDDRWMPGKLASQLELLRTQPELEMAIGRMRYFLEPGHDPPEGMRPELLEGDQVALMPTTMVVRRASFDRVGPFDEGYRIASDIDWFARAKDLGLRIGHVDELVAEKRCHDANLSHSDIATNNAELMSLLRGSIARQRGG